MNRQIVPPHTTAGVGRLPTVTINRPIPEQAFGPLADALKPFGLWLSLWNRKGECVATSPEAPRFWEMLREKGLRFVERLESSIRHTFEQCEALGGETTPGDDVQHPWGPGLGIILAPVRVRRRTVGIIAGAFVSEGFEKEDLPRLCSQFELDVQVMRGLSNSVAPLSNENRPRIAKLLKYCADRSRELETTMDELAILTHNLETTYEELHLVYEIGRHLDFSKRTISVLETVAQQLLETSRALGIAFVLREDEIIAGRANDAAQVNAPSLDDRVVQVGSGSPTLNELIRLAENLNLDKAIPNGLLLLNDVAHEKRLAFTAPWLRHLVAIPLRHENLLLGVILAMNCRDAGDFTSVDVQLFRAVADRVTPFLANRRLYDDLADLMMGLLHALVNSIDAKDPYTCGHSERVAYISRTLAEAARLSPTECERVYLAGLLHDVGKIGVPDSILCKPGKLTKEEFDILRQHPEIGGKILAPVKQVQDLIPGVLYHHERIDGRGYPRGLSDQSIPLLGRIICLADCFDAMTTNRTYRAALPIPMAAAEIRRCSGTQFDPRLAETLLKIDLEKLLEAARAFSSKEDLHPVPGLFTGFPASFSIIQESGVPMGTVS